MNSKLKITVVDDHPIFLKGLLEVLQEELPTAHLESYKSSKAAQEKILENSPDIAILDLDMPDINGIKLGIILKQKLPKLKIIILTMHKELEILQSVISQGIDGYVFKDDAVSDLVFAIEDVLQGKQYVSKLTETEPQNSDDNLINSLTKTERLILQYIAIQFTSKEIAETMFISQKTVENHRNNISRKLNLSGSNSLMKFAISNKKYF